MFVSHKVMRVSERYLSYPSEEDLSLEDELPSKLFPSDHIRMKCLLEYYVPKKPKVKD